MEVMYGSPYRYLIIGMYEYANYINQWQLVTKSEGKMLYKNRAMYTAAYLKLLCIYLTDYT